MNWFAENALLKVWVRAKLIVQNMEWNLLNLNANSVATLLNGSVGEILTSVSLVIKDKMMEIMCQENLGVSYLNVQV